MSKVPPKGFPWTGKVIVNGDQLKGKKILTNSGYALMAAIIGVNIFAILLLKSRAMWETTLQRDLEQELLFRARQYVTAIELYKKKNANIPIKNLDELFEKGFLRQRYPDPMTESGKWSLVMQDGRAGKKGLLVVPEEMLEQYIGQALIVGVCSASPEEGYLEYRKKKRYDEWAVYIGEQIEKEMPELKYVDREGGDDKKGGNDSRGDDSRGDDTGDSREDPGSTTGTERGGSTGERG